jgi:hypothetical protein
MTTPTPPLSPAAQAVWDAWNDAYEAQGPLEDMGHPLAAALIAAVDQVVPLELCLPEQAPIEGHIRQDQRGKIRRQLLAIAAELRQEGQS